MSILTLSTFDSFTIMNHIHPLLIFSNHEYINTINIRIHSKSIHIHNSDPS